MFSLIKQGLLRKDEEKMRFFLWGHRGGVTQISNKPLLLLLLLNGAILYISMTGNLLHINYSLWVFLLDKLDYG